MAVPNAPAGPRSFSSSLTPTLAGATVRPTIDEPKGVAPSAINPTLEGEREIVQSVSNAPKGVAPSAINPTLVGPPEPAYAVTPGVAATGTIQCVARANLVDNDFFTVSDGATTVIFEYQVTGGFVPTPGRVTIDVQAGGGGSTPMAALTLPVIVANLALTGDAPASLITLTNTGTRGAAGNVTITENVADAGFTVTGMSGGVNEIVVGFPSPNSPLLTVPTAQQINWTPNTGPQAAVRATTPVAVRTAGILSSTGAVVAGSGGPPYVSGNVTVGENQVGTNVILTPPIE